VRARGVAGDRRDPDAGRRDAAHAGKIARAVDAVPEQVEADADVPHPGRGEGAGDVVDLHARTPCARRTANAAAGDPLRGIGSPPVAGRAGRIAAFLRECLAASARPANLVGAAMAAPTGATPRRRLAGRASTRPRDWPATARRGQMPPEAGVPASGRLRQTLRT